MEHFPTHDERRIENSLALLGGEASHVSQWPTWPRAGRKAQRGMLNVLHSTKWTISGRSRVMPSQERVFAEQFADYVGRGHGVSCASGTAALTIALQALDVGFGDEVIVPALTWVACASSVANLGAIPVVVDVDPASLCASPDAVRSAITPRTRAVLGVHMYASRVDAYALETLCAEHGLPLIEDASQAHGARLGTRRIGAFGTVAVFSFQQSKLLTSGEGGIAVTDDPAIFRRMQQLRADGRIYAESDGDPWRFTELTVGGDVMGRNLCMSEFQSVLLREGLERLDVENEHRWAMAGFLGEMLDELGWVSLVRDQLEPRDGATFYKCPLRFSDSRLVALGPELLARALTAELNLPVEPLDRPLPRVPLYRVDRSSILGRVPELAERAAPDRFVTPVAEAAWRSAVALPHHSLLASTVDMEAIVNALIKIQTNADALEAHARHSQASGGAP